MLKTLTFKIFVFLTVLSFLSSTKAHALPSACSPEPAAPSESSVSGTNWVWYTDRDSSGNGEFCAKESSGLFLTGTVSRQENGVAVFTIGTGGCTSPVGGECTNLTAGTVILGLEVENLGLFIQPVKSSEKQPIVSLLAGTCPTQSLVGTTGVSGNFVINQWFPGVSLTSTTQVAFGKFLYDTASTPVLKALNLRRMTDLADLGVSTLSLTTGTCTGSGEVAIGGVSDIGDMKGKLFFGPPFYNGTTWTQAFTYRTLAGNTYFGTPDVAIDSRADLNGTYTGFAYNTSSTGRTSVKAVKLDINLSGTSATAAAYADATTNSTGGTFEDGGGSRTFTIPSSGQTLNGITYGAGIGCSSGGVNCPTNGMISGQINDGTNNRNMTCGVIINTGRPFLNCVLQGLTSASTPTNMLLALRRPLPGLPDTSQPFGCPCESGTFQTWNNSTNQCTTDPMGGSCTAGSYTGKVSTNITTGNDNAWGVTVVPETSTSQRRIAVAGVCIPASGEVSDASFTSAGSINEGCVSVYTLDGLLDTTFSTNGHRWEHAARAAKNTWQTSYTNVTSQSDGKIIALGSVNIAASQQNWVIARYNVNGSLDTSFVDTSSNSADYTNSAAGIVYQSFSNNASEVARDALVDPSNGRIMVTGYTGTMIGFAQLTSTGNFQSKVSYNVGTAANAGFAVIRQVLSGGVIKYIVAGYASNNGTSGRDALLMRFTSDGVLDGLTTGGNIPFGPTASNSSVSNNCTASSSSNGQGRVCTNLRFAEGTVEDVALDVTLDPQGRIVVVGSRESSGANFQIARFTAHGVLDTSFDTDGIYSYTTAMQPNAVFVQPDGKIVVTGGASSKFKALRFNVDSGTGAVSLDTSFNAGGTTPGIVEQAMYANVNARAGSTIQPDGRILIVGSTGALFQILRLWW